MAQCEGGNDKESYIVGEMEGHSEGESKTGKLGRRLSTEILFPRRALSSCYMKMVPVQGRNDLYITASVSWSVLALEAETKLG